MNKSGREDQVKDRDEVKEMLAELIPQHRQKANKDLEEKNRFFFFVFFLQFILLLLKRFVFIIGFINPNECYRLNFVKNHNDILSFW